MSGADFFSISGAKPLAVSLRLSRGTAHGLGKGGKGNVLEMQLSGPSFSELPRVHDHLGSWLPPPSCHGALPFLFSVIDRIEDGQSQKDP